MKESTKGKVAGAMIFLGGMLVGFAGRTMIKIKVGGEVVWPSCYTVQQLKAAEDAK